MATLVIDRSTNLTSVVLSKDNGSFERLSLPIWHDFDAHAASQTLPSADPIPHPISKIIVGTGPGSFAGIRSALAFAQGYAIGSGCEVLGLTSAAAFAQEAEPTAVVGDARRGKFWIALFDGFNLISDIFQVESEDLGKRVPRGVKIFSPDWKRIGETLKELFGDFASPAPDMDAAALARAAFANPSLLKREPLPIYLNPAVRD